jgi:hypothetical protein
VYQKVFLAAPIPRAQSLLLQYIDLKQRIALLLRERNTDSAASIRCRSKKPADRTLGADNAMARIKS